MNEPSSSAEIVGQVLDASARLAKRSFRLQSILFVVLLAVIGILGYFLSNSISGNHNKDAQIKALTSKSAEQTIAEIQLREDVNSVQRLNKALSANHTSALSVYCSIAVTIHDTLPPVAKYCPSN